jgi:hypothetical protein
MANWCTSQNLFHRCRGSWRRYLQPYALSVAGKRQVTWKAVGAVRAGGTGSNECLPATQPLTSSTYQNPSLQVQLRPAGSSLAGGGRSLHSPPLAHGLLTHASTSYTAKQAVLSNKAPPFRLGQHVANLVFTCASTVGGVDIAIRAGACSSARITERGRWPVAANGGTVALVVAWGGITGIDICGWVADCRYL